MNDFNHLQLLSIEQLLEMIDFLEVTLEDDTNELMDELQFELLARRCLEYSQA